MTLRARLTLWYAATLASVMVLYGAFVYVTVARRMSEQLDRAIHDDYERAEELLAYRGDAAGARWLPPRIDRMGEHPPPLSTVHVIGADGRTIHRSAAFVEDGSLRILEWRHEVKADPPGSGTETVTIRAARPTAGMDGDLRRLLYVLGLGLPVGVGAATFGGYLLARRALAPVGDMAARARQITAERLSERLRVENPGDEVGQLATVFNETLERLERSFERLRRFTADASHELRTPLTSMRAVGEVALREPKDAAGYREVVGSMLEEADRLTRLVESLLTLSRADAGQARLEPAQLDLAELGREVVAHLWVLAEEKGQSVVVDAPRAVAVMADRAVLRLAVVNLLDNAVKHGPDGSTVRVGVEARDGAAVLEVADEGPGISNEHKARVFDRFYRIEESRSRQAGGVGLGLAIARWAVEAHGGRLELVSGAGRGSVSRIVLPLAGAATGGAS